MKNEPLRKRATVLILLCLIICMTASCSFSPSPQLVGEWVNNQMERFTFCKDGTCYETTDSILSSTLMNYKIEGNTIKLYYTILGTNAVEVLNYSISDGILTLIRENGDQMQYVRANPNSIRPTQQTVSKDHIKQDVISKCQQSSQDYDGLFDNHMPDVITFQYGKSEISDTDMSTCEVTASFQFPLGEFVTETFEVQLYYKWDILAKDWELDYSTLCATEAEWTDNIVGHFEGENCTLDVSSNKIGTLRFKSGDTYDQLDFSKQNPEKSVSALTGNSSYYTYIFPCVQYDDKSTYWTGHVYTKIRVTFIDGEYLLINEYGDDILIRTD